MYVYRYRYAYMCKRHFVLITRKRKTFYDITDAYRSNRVNH